MFRVGNGFVTRDGAADAIASHLGAKKENIQVLSLLGKFGDRDLDCKALIFSDPKIAKAQVPRYLSIRKMPKDQRKIARDEAKAKKKAAAATPKPASQQASPPPPAPPAA